jgi:hypothetical protein
MRQLGWQPAAAAFVALAAGANVAAAQLTTREAAAVVVFPKVIADGTWETTIQLSNTANRPARALCYYVNGALTFPDQPPGPGNAPQWSQVDFTLTLVRQQPTQWVVSRGRAFDPTDQACASPLDDCDGTGIDPGSIPPSPPGFTGELLCIENDASGAPWSGNALIGHATLTHLASGEVVKYPAIGARGFDTNDADGTLCLGGEPQEGCPKGGEYDACAQQWDVSHPAEFDDRPVDGGSSRTRLTIVPCGQDFETQVPERITLQLRVTNEFEMAFSASTTVDCWGDVRLADFTIFDRDVLGSSWVHTRLQTASSTSSAFTVVQQSVRESGEPPLFTAVATIPAQREAAEEPNRIVVPQEGVE